VGVPVLDALVAIEDYAVQVRPLHLQANHEARLLGVAIEAEAPA